MDLSKATWSDREKGKLRLMLKQLWIFKQTYRDTQTSSFISWHFLIIIHDLHSTGLAAHEPKKIFFLNRKCLPEIEKFFARLATAKTFMWKYIHVSLCRWHFSHCTQISLKHIFSLGSVPSSCTTFSRLFRLLHVMAFSISWYFTFRAHAHTHTLVGISRHRFSLLVSSCDRRQASLSRSLHSAQNFFLESAL